MCVVKQIGAANKADILRIQKVMKTDENRILRKQYSTDFREEEMLGDLK
jgi:hypothetical protein